MATILLGAVGGAIGASVGGAVAGVSAAVIGKAIGSYIGSAIDNYLLITSQHHVGPMIEKISIMKTGEGEPVPKLWGRMRVGGHIIWNSDFKQLKTTTGGKGKPTPKQTTYSAQVSFAVAFCEGGDKVELGRIWLDNKLVDKSSLDFAFYTGSETQLPDPTIQSVDGTDNTPAFRGICYIVFTDMNLKDYSNRIPQVSAEIEVFLPESESGDGSDLIRSVHMVDGTGEMFYNTTNQIGRVGTGPVIRSNNNYDSQIADLRVSTENLLASSSFVNSVTIPVVWFGDDLRASSISIKPMVAYNDAGYEIEPDPWSVSGLGRSSVPRVSYTPSSLPSFNGTPSDKSLLEAISYFCNESNFRVTISPKLKMDIPEGNTLPSLVDGSAGQPPYPIPKGISVSLPSVDKTPSAVAEMSNFFGSVVAGDFTRTSTSVSYTGLPSDNGYRKFVLHYAHLLVVAAESVSDQGKIERFIVGSGLKGITDVRSTPSSSPTASTFYPGVHEMSKLITDVKSLFDSAGMTGVQVVYAADWDEYGAHVPEDGSGDVYFNMDEIFSNPSCHAVAMNNYVPLTDIRSGTEIDISTPDPDTLHPENFPFFHTISPGETDWLVTTGNMRRGQGEAPVPSYFFESSGSANFTVNVSPSATGSRRFSFEYISYNQAAFNVGDELIVSIEGLDFFDNVISSDTATGLKSMTEAKGQVSLIVSSNITKVRVTISSVLGTNGSDGLPHMCNVDIYNLKLFTFEEGNDSSIQVTKDLLSSNVESGEFYDYEYASSSDRVSGLKTFISDPVYSEPWTFRKKDIKGWWSNEHRSRPAGVQDATVVGLSDGSGGQVTTWTPGAKSFQFAEIGCPNVHRGSNQPWSFVDPKSGDSSLPYFSNGSVDEVSSLLHNEALIEFWSSDSTVIGSTALISPQNISVNGWEVRPFPSYPNLSSVWPDTDLYLLGKSMNGRIKSMKVQSIISDICTSRGMDISEIDLSGMSGSGTLIKGFFSEGLVSGRSELESLMSGYNFTAIESGEVLKFKMLKDSDLITVDSYDFVNDSEVDSFSITKAQSSEKPGGVVVTFIDENNDYNKGSSATSSKDGMNTLKIDLPIIMGVEQARSLASMVEQSALISSEKIEFPLPMNYYKIEQGDTLEFEISGRPMSVRVEKMSFGDYIQLEGVLTDRSIWEGSFFTPPPACETCNPMTETTVVYSKPEVAIMEIPLFSRSEPYHHAPRFAAYQNPFSESIDAYKSMTSGDVKFYGQLRSPTVMGFSTTPLNKGKLWMLDWSETVNVRLSDPAQSLQSLPQDQILSGLNAAAIRGQDGSWEIIQFTNAELIGAGPEYRLSGLLRGQFGTEVLMPDHHPSNSTFVFLGPDKIGVIELYEQEMYSSIDYKFGTNELPTTSDKYYSLSHTGQATGLLPYAPVHAKKTNIAPAGDTEFTWIRQTRFGPVDFENPSPVNEESEAYDIEICDTSGSKLREVVDLTTPYYLYTSQQQSDDGGTLDSYIIKVWQKSAIVGRGRKMESKL
jgi:hypothetical protein